MTTIDEGYIKYTCDWQKTPPPPADCLSDLNHWRDKLYQLGLIGVYDNGIGFGNISIRDTNPNRFIVSGTQTGGLPKLTPAHYVTVTDFDLDCNSLTCQGAIKASSESLTHAAAYQANPSINAVIHVHHRPLWERLMDKVPTTSRDCAYGTPEMAREISRICRDNITTSPKILVMSGHDEGMITFGHNLDEAGQILLTFYGQSSAI